MTNTFGIKYSRILNLGLHIQVTILLSRSSALFAFYETLNKGSFFSLKNKNNSSEHKQNIFCEAEILFSDQHKK